MRDICRNVKSEDDAKGATDVVNWRPMSNDELRTLLHDLDLNLLAQLSGVSRRTLERMRQPDYEPSKLARKAVLRAVGSIYSKPSKARQ